MSVKKREQIAKGLRKTQRQEQRKRELRHKYLQAGIIVASVLLIVAIVIVAIVTDTPLGKLDGYTTSKKATDYVRMNISYTDANGQKQTGDVVIKLRPDVAPLTVENYQKLVEKGYYDGTPFHRIRKNFMIQGGDPNGDGISDGDWGSIHGEFAANGYNNPLSHKRGVISMARTNDFNSASTQFFIVHEDSTDSLDGNYAAFGEVVYGMETVDGIANTAVKLNSTKSEMSAPINAVTINKMVFVTPNV